MERNGRFNQTGTLVSEKAKEILENCGGNMSGGSVGLSEEGNLNTVMGDEKEVWPVIQRPLLRE